MAENSRIEWTDHTFNPWVGCTKVSPACDHCYAERDTPARVLRARGVETWGANAQRVRTSRANWKLPLKWNRQAQVAAAGWADGVKLYGSEEAALAAGQLKPRRPRVFCASLADVFDNQVPPAWRAELFALIAATPHLDWLLLTKRVGNVAKMIEAPGMQKSGLPANVWLGATVATQAEADRDIPKLLATPAAVRFLSVEPMLGPISLDCWPVYGEDERPLLHWVICGGESGPGARPMHPQWARDLRDQCERAGVPFFFKQWGEWVPRSACYHRFEDGTSCADLDPGATLWPCIRLTESGHDGRNLAHAGGGDDAYMQRVGKLSAGRLLDGRLHDSFPEVAR